jgi:hypothetical protein
MAQKAISGPFFFGPAIFPPPKAAPAGKFIAERSINIRQRK